EKKLHVCRAILAARSEVFDKLLYNGMKETYENQISFPKINSAGMEIILEYIYTGSVKKESLTKDNLIEAFFAAHYFQLSDLQDFIIKTIKSTNFVKDYSPELLTKLPTLEQIENSIEVENKLLIDHQKVTKELEPLVLTLHFMSQVSRLYPSWSAHGFNPCP
ncbi:BTB/POZ protein, partial [Rhizophagus irregularis DAOM 181602=DAOM 197198]